LVSARRAGRIRLGGREGLEVLSTGKIRRNLNQKAKVLISCGTLSVLEILREFESEQGESSAGDISRPVRRLK